MKSKKPVELLKESCDEFKKARLAGGLGRIQDSKWYMGAAQMCATIETKSPEALKALAHEHMQEAESASGQDLVTTCRKFERDVRAGLMRGLEKASWYQSASKTCA